MIYLKDISIRKMDANMGNLNFLLQYIPNKLAWDGILFENKRIFSSVCVCENNWIKIQYFFYQCWNNYYLKLMGQFSLNLSKTIKTKNAHLTESLIVAKWRHLKGNKPGWEKIDQNIFSSFTLHFIFLSS